VKTLAVLATLIATLTLADAAPAKRRLVVLAAGDSLTYNLAYGMRREFPRRRIQVHTDVSQGRGLSKPGYDWPGHGREVVERVKPDVVFLFLGGNEGFPLGTAECCGQPWIDAYAAKQRELMQAYSRGGQARVYWLNLPAPGPTRPGHRTTWAAENQALISAAANGDATIFDTNALLSPGFRFRRWIRWHGKMRKARDRDDIHLTRSGGMIVAEALLKRLRDDQVVEPAR
jgi:hypothetical protein